MNEKTLHSLCDVLSEELDDVTGKIHQNGSMTAGDLELVDKLSHALKSIKTTMAMMDADDGYSFENRRTYRDGRGYGGMRRSYRRSRNGYSYAEDDLDSLLEEMRGMMGSLPEEKRKEVERFINKME